MIDIKRSNTALWVLTKNIIVKSLLHMPLNVKKQWLYSEAFTNVGASHSFMENKISNSAQEPNSCHLFSQTFWSLHMHEHRKIDCLVNRVFHPQPSLFPTTVQHGAAITLPSLTWSICQFHSIFSSHSWVMNSNIRIILLSLVFAYSLVWILWVRSGVVC